MKKLMILLFAGAIAMAFTVYAQTTKINPGKTDSCYSKAEIDLQLNMRKLWEDHIVYTRSYITSALAGLEDEDAVSQRLLKNQDDIGKAIKPYYGQDAADRLAALLKDHILIATEVVKAVKAGNKENLDNANKRWHANGDEIAIFLSSANPKWGKKDLADMMNGHLNLLTDQVIARNKKSWAADIAAYDKGHTHILKFADELTGGIVKQFPGKFEK